MRRKLKGKEQGITLVALVVTIVVLLILAGITIVYVFGDNGVFGKATEAKVATELGKIEEQAGIIYADKFLENQGGNVPNREIVDKLIENGNNIEIRNVGAGAVTGISLEPAEVSMDQSETATVKVKLEGAEDGNIYYAVIDGKYYKMNFQGSELTIEREATTPEGNVAEPASIEVVTGYDTTIVTKAEINQSAKTIEITANGTKYGNTSITVKYGSHTDTCNIIVEEKETDWVWMNRVAKSIANDHTINSDSLQAIGSTEKGEAYDISVGNIFKVRYDGILRRVRVLGFKHDDLVDHGVYKDGKDHEKAGISFEFLDFMTGDEYMAVDSDNVNTSGWEAMELRGILNGIDGTIGGLGAKLSNKSYIKQVKKQYISIYNDPSSVKTCNDYLWLLASSEIFSFDSFSNRYGNAVANEGKQYAAFEGVIGTSSVKHTLLIRYTGESAGAYEWSLRSPSWIHINCNCLISSSRKKLLWIGCRGASRSCSWILHLMDICRI